MWSTTYIKVVYLAQFWAINLGQNDRIDVWSLALQQSEYGHWMK